MGEGRYDERIGDLPDNEIGELGDTLNVMASRLVQVIGKLSEEKSQLERIIGGIGEGVLAVSAGFELLHSNETFLELAGTAGVEGFLEGNDAAAVCVRGLLQECMAQGNSCVGEWTDPSGRCIQATASPLMGADAHVQGGVCLLRDVSEEQRLEKLRRDYVANISHELRTPLTGIRGMVEPLMDGCMESEAERQACYEVILKETVRLQKLVGEMLDMSRLQDGRLVVETEELELPGIMEAAAHRMQTIAAEAGVALEIETGGSALRCRGNEDRILQVLIILLDNALSFTPRGGRVTLFGRDAAAYVEIGVRDTGAGIEPKDLPLIWERFFKADRSRMRTGGTGLGLSIAKLVVELMNGHIRAESEPGKGAVFTVTLPKE